MSFLSYLHPAPVITVDDLREFMRRHHFDDYHLIDVRQPKEYAAGHLPGARLIPMEVLKAQVADLPAGKPVILYCSAGARSRAAAHVVLNAGFREVHSLRGGIDAWRGKLAEGLPEEDVAFFAAASTPQEQVVFAWRFEEGTRRFYAEMAASVQDREAASLFRELTNAEEHHKATLQAIYEGLSATTGDFRGWDIPPEEMVMEGGMRLQEAIAWTHGRPVTAILELGMALETNAFDRYLILSRDLPDENSRRIFEVLSDEERHHLEKLSRLLDHFL